MKFARIRAGFRRGPCIARHLAAVAHKLARLICTTLALRVADDVAILTTGRIVHAGAAADMHAKPDVLQQNLGII